jgi:NAD-dependent DNA ligase
MSTATKTSDTSKKVKVLEEKIQEASDYYYNTGKTLIPDSEFDKLVDELRTLNPKSKVLKRTGAKVKTGKGRAPKVKLPYPLYSLTKIKPDTTDDWLKNHKGPYVVSIKEDGVSLEIVYKDGTIKAYTKGDSIEGQDVSHLIPYLNIPQKLKQDIAIRGELTMDNSVFKKFYDAEFENPRNLISGSVTKVQIHAAIVAKHIKFLCHSILNPRYKPSKEFAELKRLGFSVVKYKEFPTLTSKKLETLLTSSKKKHLRYMDGLVITQDIKVPLLMDSNPKHSVSFKAVQEGDTAQVKVTGVTWELSKHGKLIPTIQVQPVRLSEVTVTNFSGHNAYFIVHGWRSKDAKKHVGDKWRPINKGTIVKVVRSGDVIPHIIEVVTPSKNPSMPKEKYEWDATNINILATGNMELADDKLLTQFFTTLKIEDISLKTIQQFVKAGYDTVAKIIKATPSDFLKLDGFQRTKASKLYKNIHEKLTDIPLHTLMTASACFGSGLGERKLLPLVKKYPNVLKDSIKWSESTLLDNLNQVEGFSDKTSMLFSKGLAKFKKFLKDTGLKPAEIKIIKATSSKLKGQAVLFTGFRSEELEQAILNNGGTIASSVTKATILLAKDIYGNSSKIVKAMEKNIPVMTTQTFKKKYGL